MSTRRRLRVLLAVVAASAMLTAVAVPVAADDTSDDSARDRDAQSLQEPARSPEVVTWNVQHEMGHSKLHLWQEEIISTLPKVIGVQEICGYEADHLANRLHFSGAYDDMYYEFKPAVKSHIPCFGGEFGNAILSVSRLRNVDHGKFEAQDGEEDRSYIAATTKIRGQDVRVINTHLSSESHDVRLAQLTELGQLSLEGPDLPTVVMGDLNLGVRRSEELHALRSMDAVFGLNEFCLQAPDPESACTTTFEHPDEGEKRIDHILIRGLEPEAYIRYPATDEFNTADGSDHAMLQAWLTPSL